MPLDMEMEWAIARRRIWAAILRTIHREARSRGQRIRRANEQDPIIGLERWNSLGLMGSHLLVGGVDVTDRCRRFNQVDGWADCFIRDSRGRVSVNADRTAINEERIHGKVEIMGEAQRRQRERARGAA